MRLQMLVHQYANQVDSDVVMEAVLMRVYIVIVYLNAEMDLMKSIVVLIAYLESSIVKLENVFKVRKDVMAVQIVGIVLMKKAAYYARNEMNSYAVRELCVFIFLKSVMMSLTVQTAVTR